MCKGLEAGSSTKVLVCRKALFWLGMAWRWKEKRSQRKAGVGFERLSTHSVQDFIPWRVSTRGRPSKAE